MTLLAARGPVGFAPCAPVMVPFAPTDESFKEHKTSEPHQDCQKTAFHSGGYQPGHV